MAKVSWPAWRYGPGGQARIFQEESEVPDGWVDSQVEAARLDEEAAKPTPKPKVRRGRKPKAKAKDKVQEDARLEALRTLRDAGVEITDDASDEELQAALEALE